MRAPPSEHGNCPHCGVSLDGGGIWDHFYKEFTQGHGYWKNHKGEYSNIKILLSPPQARVAADKVAAQYGATRTKGRWGRAIGIEEWGEDRISRWRCPDCEGEWPRT